MRAMVSVNGHDLPAPSVYNATTSTVVDSARNAEGVMIGAVIRDDLGKVEMTWNYIDAQQWADMLALFSTKRGGSFTNPVTYFSQDINGWETREMYISDRTAGVWLRRPDGSIRGYQGARLALIQV